jgi:Uma2 family endonuclease
MSAVLIKNETPEGRLFRDYSGVIEFNFGSALKRMTDDEFLKFCKEHEGWRIEMTKEGDLIVMPGTGGLTGKRNSTLNRMLGNWAETDGRGQVFDSQTFFRLQNGAKRMPDVAWVKNERWDSLSEEEQEGIIPFAPDFVIELRSRTDIIEDLKAKMKEFIENNVQLGWLIDPKEKKVYVYRPNAKVETLDDPQEISGEPLLKGFVLKIKEIWD